MGSPNQIWIGAAPSGGASLLLESPHAFKIAPAAPRLLDRVRQAIRARHYSPKTEKSYIAWIRRYVVFHGKRHPSDMGADEVRAFLSFLASESASPRAQLNRCVKS
jgi:hypothetical protein